MIDLGFDQEQLRRDQDREARRMLGASTGAIRATTKDLERRLEARTRAKVPGNLWRGLASEAYPKQGIARDPSSAVFLKGRSRTQGAFKFYTDSGMIRPRSGKYLAVPTKAAQPGTSGFRGWGRGPSWVDLSPAEWQRRTGVELRYIHRFNKPPVLVADGRITASGRFSPPRAGARTRTGALRRGIRTVVIFTLLPATPFKGGLTLAGEVRATDGHLRRELQRHLAQGQDQP